MVFYQQIYLINNNNSASSPKKINKRLKQTSSNHPNLSRNRRRARPNRKASPESIMAHVHALLWYFIFTILPRPETDTKPFRLHTIVHTILFLYAEQHRNSKRANSVVTFRRQQCRNKERERERERRLWRARATQTRKRLVDEKRDEMMFHVETLREDLAVCCSNIRSPCLMRFLLYRGRCHGWFILRCRASSFQDAVFDRFLAQRTLRGDER